jgi:L-threonylcarbamoyladenylate synthase
MVGSPHADQPGGTRPEPRTLVVDLTRGDDPSISAAAAALRAGGVLLHATDTVYGLGALATRDDAVERIRTLKERGAGPFLLLLRREWLPAWTSSVPGRAARDIELFWPGALTAILPASPRVPDGLRGERGVAVREPDSAFLLALLARVGGPVVSTSANRAGRPPALDARAALDAVPSGWDLLLDGGPAKSPGPSTIVDYTTTPPTVVRRGALALPWERETPGP